MDLLQNVQRGKVGLNNLRPNLKTLQHFFNGTFLESFDALVTSDGATITLSIEQSGGGDLTMMFSDGFSILDCTPTCTVSLTAGSDTSPQENFVYVLQSTKALTVSTSDWPSTEHIKVAYVTCFSATKTQSDGGALINQNWNDHATGTDNQGHLTHVTERIRRSGAIYKSGVAPTVTITTNAGVPDNVDVALSAGVIYQMHKQNTPAQDSAVSDDFHIVNHPTTPYFETMDLNSELTDASGNSMTNKYFNLVLWAVGNKGGEYHPMMINLPTGSYNNLTDAQNDVDGYDVFTIPDAFVKESSTGFLIARFTFRHQNASGGTWTLETTTDLRGQTPQVAAGGGTGIATTEFSDNQFKIFDDGDVSKIFQFEASNITTATTRSYTVQDVDGVMALQDAVLTSGSIPYINASGQLDENNTALFWDSANNRLSIGAQENTVTINGTAFGASFGVHTEGDTDLLGLTEHRHSDTAAFGAHFVGVRSRGSEGAETVVQDGDVLVRLDALGHDGTDYEVAGQIDFEVDGTPGSNDMPGRILFKVSPDGSNVPAEAMRISQDKTIDIKSTLTLTSSTNNDGFYLNNGTDDVVQIYGKVGSNDSGVIKLKEGGNDRIVFDASGTYRVSSIADGENNLFQFKSFGAVENQFVCEQALGSESVPTTVTNGRVLGRFSFRGYDGTAWSGTQGGFYCAASQTWAVGAHGTDLIFQTTANGTTTLSERMRIEDSGQVGINDPAPSYQLDVNGICRFQSYISIGTTPFSNRAINAALSAGPAGSSGVYAIRMQPTRTSDANASNGIQTFWSQPTINTTGTVGVTAHYWCVDTTVTSGTLTNQYGIYVPNLTAATNNYGVYQLGSGVKNLLSGSLVVGSPTGGDKGTGTINAQGVYDDNVLLTCYPFDAYFDGKISNRFLKQGVKKDYKVPSRDEFCSHMKNKRHMPCFPSREEWDDKKKPSSGQMINKLWEQLEHIALYVKELHEENKDLKKQLNNLK